MARKYVRDNRGRFASVGATSRGGRLRTAAGNKRASQTRRINAKPANTIAKPKGLQPGTIKPRARRSAATSTLRPGELMNANARPVNTVGKFRKGVDIYTGKRAGSSLQNISDASRFLASKGVKPQAMSRDSLQYSMGAIASASPGIKEVQINARNKWWADPKKSAIEQRKIGQFSTSDPRGVLFHELGHVKHVHASFSSGAWDNDRQRSIARRVSKYATTNKREFVAETYAGIKTGRRYDYQVMRAYREAQGLSTLPPARRRSRIRRKP